MKSFDFYKIAFLEQPSFTKNLPAKIESPLSSLITFEVKLNSLTYPTAAIIWLKDSVEIIDSSEFTLVSEGLSYKMSFNSRREFDGSVFSVRAKNEIGEITSESKVSILCKFYLTMLFFTTFLIFI
jgi:hypothetical protein